MRDSVRLLVSVPVAEQDLTRHNSGSWHQEPMLEVFRHVVGVMPLYFLKQRLK